MINNWQVFCNFDPCEKSAFLRNGLQRYKNRVYHETILNWINRILF